MGVMGAWVWMEPTMDPSSVGIHHEVAAGIRSYVTSGLPEDPARAPEYPAESSHDYETLSEGLLFLLLVLLSPLV